MENFDIVTGAFSFTGKYIAKKLIERGRNIKTFTNRVEKKTLLDNSIIAVPYYFNELDKLQEEMKGCEYFYNTYWIRFPYKGITFDKAIEDTKKLIGAAKEVKVKKFLHISITNASENSDLLYFRGKGIIERLIIESGLSYGIVRPAVVFGIGDILINNITWLLKHFPLFIIMGDGKYKLQPIYVEDLAQIIIEASEEKENLIIDAVGPEIFTYKELILLIAETVQSYALILHLPSLMVYWIGKFLGLLMKDVMLTGDEIKALMRNYLISDSLPKGKTKLSMWLKDNTNIIGEKYASELKRHYKKSRMHLPVI